MIINELPLQIKESVTTLTVDGQMRVGLFMPFWAVFVKESADLKAKLKSRVITLAITRTKSRKSAGKGDFKAIRTDRRAKKVVNSPLVARRKFSMGSGMGRA